MRKVLCWLVLVLEIFSLFACDYMDNQTLEFQNSSFHQFTYEGNDFTITNQIIYENNLGSLKEAFLKTLVVDIKTQKFVGKSNSDTITLAYGGLYHFGDSLAISINHAYYKVSLNSDVRSKDQILSIEGVENDSVGRELLIDTSDCRVIKWNHRKYRISSEIVADGTLRELLGVIADSKTFVLDTGREVSKSERIKIDDFGRNVAEAREVWVYGQVYSLDKTDTVAVEINDEYRIAYLE